MSERTRGVSERTRGVSERSRGAELEEIDDFDEKKEDNEETETEVPGEDDVRIGTILAPGTFRGRIPPGMYRSGGNPLTSARSEPSSPRESSSASLAHSSPPHERRHKQPYRQRTQSGDGDTAPTRRTQSLSYLDPSEASGCRSGSSNEPSQSSQSLVQVTQSLSNLQLTDFENQEQIIPDQIPEEVLVRILGQMDDVVTDLTKVRSFEELAQKWMAIRKRHFRLDHVGMLTTIDINLEYEQMLFTLSQLRLKFMQMQLIQHGSDHESDTSYTYTSRFARLYEIIYNIRTVLFARLRMDELSDTQKHYEMGQFRDYIDPGYFTYLKYDQKLTSFQKFLLYVLQQASFKRYRKRWAEFTSFSSTEKTVCLYEQIMTPNGHPTHAWKKVMSIEQFVGNLINHDTNFDQWCEYTRVRGMMSTIREELKRSNDTELPFLVRQQHMFAFLNGIYDAKQMKFFTYNHPLPSTVVCANYFPQNFDELLMCEMDVGKISAISIPPLEKILNTHKIPADAQFVILAMLGRCFHKLNELERWQIAPFFLGLPGTGKSTLAAVITQIYDPEDIGAIDSNMEAKFGVSAFAERFIAICTEISEKFVLTHTMLQSMIDGERVSYPVKYGDPRQINWFAHTLLFTNVIPPHWTEFGGNLLRRFLAILFNNDIGVMQTNLQEQLLEYLPTIIHKCNMCYQLLVKEWGKTGFWEHAPEYFQQTRQHLALMVSPIHAFIETSGFVEVTHVFTDMIPSAEFYNALNQFCHERGFLTKKWTRQYCMPTFRRLGIQDSENKLRNIKFTQDYHNKHSFGMGRSFSAPNITTRDHLDDD